VEGQGPLWAGHDLADCAVDPICQFRGVGALPRGIDAVRVVKRRPRFWLCGCPLIGTLQFVHSQQLFPADWNKRKTGHTTNTVSLRIGVFSVNPYEEDSWLNLPLPCLAPCWFSLLVTLSVGRL
jgi:hypothetical protein